MGLDSWIISADQALRTLAGGAHAARPSPSADESTLSPADRKLSGALLRVDHVGEVCAQALYQAQALTARDERLRAHMQRAAEQEVDHLAWTERRLEQLGARTSLLNPLWYAGSFGIGLVAGLAGDRWSLGFVVETERQVEQHLAGHLDRLPPDDAPSRAIVRADEARRGRARNGGRTERRRITARAGQTRDAPCGACDDADRASHLTRGALGRDDLVADRDLRRLGQHRGCRAVLLVRQRHRARHGLRVQLRTADGEVHVDAREHLRVGRRALGF